MTSLLSQIIVSNDPQVRDRSLDAICRGLSLAELEAECAELEALRHASDNLYERVRALFFLYAIYRFHLPTKEGVAASGKIPFEGHTHLLQRRFEEGIELFLMTQTTEGPSHGLSSALATAYHSLGFQTLADQVRQSVRSVKGNRWMFRIGHPADHPLRIRPSLLKRGGAHALFPLLKEMTPVRMDLTHSGWSDIFFLGMDFPEGARVINTSINLAVRGADGSDAPTAPHPPVEAYLRIIDEPVLRLTSVDLKATADITTFAELFDYARDYLGLLKAAVIASGIVPPGMEGVTLPLSDLLSRLVKPGYGLELVSQVNGIPKGSRLAVSTNLLASLITVCMRATGQTESLTGLLQEHERRQVAARAILGEWLAGSGGGWQDSGGVWPGMKLIEGVEAAEGDPEFGVSRGCLLPTHHIFGQGEVSAETRQRLQESLVLVHGGMAQNVGPILEMVTEKYLLRSEVEWAGRKHAIALLDDVVAELGRGDIRAIGNATQRNFFGPIQTIIPWATNLYTEMLIEAVTKEFGDDFWGFWMLGGMAGGGMGFIFAPQRKSKGQQRLQQIMSEAKAKLEKAVPFAMDPVVYDFAINEEGTVSIMLSGDDALMPAGYYTEVVPELLRLDPGQLPPVRRGELERFGEACRTDPTLSGTVQNLFDRLFPRPVAAKTASTLPVLLSEYGFDSVQHEAIRSDLKSGRIGLAQNLLPVNSKIEDVLLDDVAILSNFNSEKKQQLEARGRAALKRGELAVVSLAGGAGSRWTQGAGVVKALNPFAKLAGKHRNFIEIHLAKSQFIAQQVGMNLPHVLTTSYLTHQAIAEYLEAEGHYGYAGPLHLSLGRIVGLRLVPTVRDLRFAWEESPQQLLDEQAQKVQESVNAALINWAQQTGEGSDYTDNLPIQCLHPVGHWYEVPNMLRNGVLLKLLTERPQLKHLMVHNIDTLGANVDPTILGYHLEREAALTTEMITRNLEDRGGGLARINGRVQLIEGLALPREEIEFKLTYYNSSTTWVDIDKLLAVFGLTRADLERVDRVTEAVRGLAQRMPTYITLKDVKKRWGKGQEDIFPVTQFEKLWGDMTALPEADCAYVAVPRVRGQQLKDVAQLDGWLRDGSAAYLESICAFKETKNSQQKTANS
ncbi:MAG: UTP--glucose-1-phosphate uridylyltransferase [Chloroflexota bacterium]